MDTSTSKSKNDKNVLNHWIAFAEGLNLPALEFYDSIEKELAARKIPSMNISRVVHSEGGVLSGKRIYLRMMRERLAFDACASPFGTSYFFSCRTAYLPAVIRFWHVVVILSCLIFFFGVLVQLLGFIFAIVASIAFIIAWAQVFQNAVALGLSDLDAALMKIPAIGPVYERLFRKETYYREDTRLVYLELVPKIIRELADEVVAAKGVKLTAEYEKAPVLGELYKRVPTRDKKS